MEDFFLKPSESNYAIIIHFLFLFYYMAEVRCSKETVTATMETATANKMGVKLWPLFDTVGADCGVARAYQDNTTAFYAMFL